MAIFTSSFTTNFHNAKSSTILYPAICSRGKKDVKPFNPGGLKKSKTPFTGRLAFYILRIRLKSA